MLVAVDCLVPLGQWLPALPLAASPASEPFPQPGKTKQFVPSILGNQLWAKNPVSAEFSLLLLVSSETVFGLQLKAQKDPGLAFSEFNLWVASVCVCVCVPFGVYLCLSSGFGLEFVPYPFVPFPCGFTHNHRPVY